MNFRMVLFILGRLFIVLSILLCLPLLVSVICADGQWLSFLPVIVGTAALGICLSFKKPESTRIYAKEGFVIVAFGWILIALIGAVPLLISKQIGNYIDCVFEISSGFTTTGASIVSDVEALSPSINFWRCFSIWIGGMGVLAFLLAVLPKMDDNMQSMHIFRAEAPGPQVSKLSSKLRDTSRVLYAIYIGLTLLETIFLLCGGLNFYEAITCALSTAGTGGFYIYNASIGHFGSVYVEMVVAAFMIIFSLNFNLYYLIIIGKFVQAIKSEELRWHLSVFVGSVLAVAVALTVGHNTGSFWTSLRYGVFQVASVMSTTGFTTTAFEHWPMFASTLLVFLMIIGASSGSTGGGIKMARVIILGKSVRASSRQLLSPNSVNSIKYEGKKVDEATIDSVRTYFLYYIAIVAGTTLLISVDGLDFATNITATIACLNNIGPGLSQVGATGNYTVFGYFSKIILTITMIAGRLELFPIIMLFNRKTWTA